MVQIKASLAIVLTASAITPALSLPHRLHETTDNTLNRRSVNDIVVALARRSRYADRILEARGYSSHKSKKSARRSSKHRHEGREKNKENKPHGHSHREGQLGDSGGVDAKQDTSATDTDTSTVPQDPILESRENTPPQPKESARRGNKRRYESKEDNKEDKPHGHGHREDQLSAASGDDTKQDTPAKGTETVRQDPTLEAPHQSKKSARRGNKRRYKSKEDNKEAKPHGHGHRESAASGDDTKQDTPAKGTETIRQDPTLEAPHQSNKSARRGNNRRYKSKEDNKGHREDLSNALSSVDANQDTSAPGNGTVRTDGLFGRSFGDFDLDARELDLD